MKEYSDEFTEFLCPRIKASGISRKQIVQRAGLELNYGYKILNGGRRTREKDYVVALCIAIGLNLEDTQHALQLNRMKMLDSVSRRDAILIDAIRNRLSVEETNDLLESGGFRYLRTGRF